MNKGGREKQTINPIKHPTVTREENSRVLCTKCTFEGRFAQVSDLRQKSYTQRQTYDFHRRTLRKQPHPGQPGRAEVTENRAATALNGFARTDMRNQCVLSPDPPNGIAPCISQHCHQKDKENP